MSPAAQPYATPGTPEHAEYQRLTREILHCPDLGRAGEISRRLTELRGDRPRPAGYPRARAGVREHLADIARRWRR